MGGQRGSALVVAMLLLVLLSAAGMYVVSRSAIPSGDASHPFHRAAVARNMARAGVHAAIARLPETPGEGIPYRRRLPVGPNLSGQYSVTIRKTGRETVPGERGTVSALETYEIVSEGSVPGFPSGTARIRAEVRYGPRPSSSPRATIRNWEESSPG
jgi:hypothetical protein